MAKGKPTAQNGKGSKRLHDRTKISDEQMQSNWDLIFGKKDKDKQNDDDKK
jgi:hypothetical protein